MYERDKKILSLILFLSCCSNFVSTQFTPSGTCNVTLDTTVPQFCYANLEGRFPRGRLNFTIVYESSSSVTLRFEALPDNRQVNLEVVDDSDGLKGWASLANSFVDSVRGGSLPYDIILPYLNNTVDSPIASQCPSTSSQSSGTGDVDINNLLDDFGGWWAPIIAVTALGPVFAIILTMIGCIFCFCRLCGRCGGNLEQDYRDNLDTRCFILYIVLLCCMALLLVGTVFAFISNEKLNNSIENFNSTVNTAIDNSLDFVTDTQIEANLTVERYDEVNAFVQCEINNTHVSIGGVVIDVFESAVDPLINSSLQLADQLNSSINALMQVNRTVGRLLSLSQRLQMELNNLTDQVAQLKTDCTNALPPSVPASPCDSIPPLSYTVNVDYSVVDDVSAVLDQLQQVENIKAQALEANDTFYGIPCEIRNQIKNQTVAILNQADDFRRTIVDITTDIEREVNEVINEEGFVGDARTEASDIQETLDTYDTPRYIVSIVICSLTLLVIVVLIFGLILGAYGFERKIEPQDRTPASNCGGITLMVAVGMMFVFAVILLLLASFTFFLGANLLKVCYSIAEDPPNGLPSYELYSRVTDDPSLWGGYLLGCYILDNSSVRLTVTEMLNGCRDNGALYQVAKLAMRPELDLRNVTNISSQIPNLDDLFNRLRNEISFTPDQILTEETRDSLMQYSNAGLQSIDYVGYINQINTAISNLDVDGLITTMQTVRVAFDLAGQLDLVAQTDMIIATTQRINDTTLTEIMNLTNTLETEIIALNATASQLNQNVADVLDAADRATAELLGENGTEIVINQTRAVLDRVIAYADSYANWAIDNLENQIGRCRPLYATYNNLYYEACEDAVDGINGFWLAIGWCVLFFIPTLIFAVWLSHYFRRMRMKRLQYNIDETEHSGTYHRMKDIES